MMTTRQYYDIIVCKYLQVPMYNMFLVTILNGGYNLNTNTQCSDVLISHLNCHNSVSHTEQFTA